MGNPVQLYGPVLVFDSGIGGLSVLRQIRRLMPDLDAVYLADDAAFPYGAWEEQALVRHIVKTMEEAINTWQPRAVVIACNTASTLVLPALREHFDLPFIGTVPAIKPAAQQTSSGLVSVLATPGTVARDYTQELINQFAEGVDVKLVGAVSLAQLAEHKLEGEAVDLSLLQEEVLPCFVSKGSGKTDTVVLGCTHYPFLLDELKKVAPWPVNWIDPAPAIARQLAKILGVKVQADPPRDEHALSASNHRLFYTSSQDVTERKKEDLLRAIHGC
ncbi:glutamate racemase [Flexibacterium corallicola]|uniref:glutamate racemase n=1 Tax=Flexibacterium corallicola TaxID=3037259 RepID=UPI00286F7F01|nr:glutamate racemase [Pseudovibrio sp. M1P-2-3]